ncbi:MAG: nucleotidyl transferase AbiEii/AbiGii toxin family protein [Candidatus Dormibacteraeota bacterium]|nr:nucleotidyl transferase AbiEii/AbiGii toxin family protein [Candidatus Dormibacteraeota bacterium]MBO0762555.1 nucleotidyl transferase AbiEii/AbiGii toxin family protein [Candidatus Dormibacteraeota bacterium]
MLTRDQLRVARLLDPLPESEEFAFAGGAALIAHGLVQRSTVDLDYFASKPQEVARLLPAAEGALVGAGYEIHRVQIATETDFARLDVPGGSFRARAAPPACSREGPRIQPGRGQADAEPHRPLLAGGAAGHRRRA